MPDDDQELVQRCLARDQAACTALVEAYARLVGTIVWRGTGDRRVVEDLSQEVFLRVFRGLRGFDARAKLSTWIATIAHRVAIDHRRQRVGRGPAPRSVHVEEVDPDRLDRIPASGVVDPEARAMRDEAERLVTEGLRQLPDKFRLPLVYAAIDGLDHATIAAMLGVSPAGVKTLVHRGRQRLKAWIVARGTAGMRPGAREVTRCGVTRRGRR